MTQPATAKEGEPERAVHAVGLEPAAGRVRAVFGGETVADSARAIVMLETGHAPVHYFPREDVRMDLMRRTRHRTHCPFKGDASYWTIAVGGRTSENAVWSYEDPPPGIAAVKGYVAFYRDRVDSWHEERGAGRPGREPIA